jgi:ATP-binding cassette subfamily B protein
VSAGEVHFQDVAFSYMPERKILKGISFTVPPGRTVAIVGPSGAGKSTISRLLFRFYEPDSGRILIDGQDIAKVTQASLRAAIGLVPQEPTLFHRSLADNIAYGRPGASMDDVLEASRLAHVDTFVAGLAKGYGTLVGERGIKLSGGERQRVAIARAILADTPILILDEATSSLDSVSEAYIREAMDRLTAGRTTLIIAHRLSTVQRLDRILVFENGRIVEDGTHADLARRPNGVYRSLLETQVGSTILADAAE